MLQTTDVQLHQIADAGLSAASLHDPVLRPDSCTLTQVHAVLSDSFQSFLDQRSAPSTCPARLDPLHALVENKWHFWKQLRSLVTPALPNFFKAWHCWARFSRIGRSQQEVARRRKLDKVTDLTTKAGSAAVRNDLFRLYQLVNNYTPKQRRSRIQLRTAGGGIASPNEELAILRAYVKQIWFDETAPKMLPLCDPTPPGVPFTQQDLAVELAKAPMTKAVASPFPPNLRIKSLPSSILSCKDGGTAGRLMCQNSGSVDGLYSLESRANCPIALNI
eukprot:s700_g9.t1